jgi:hypothetical protein
MSNFNDTLELWFLTGERNWNVVPRVEWDRTRYAFLRDQYLAREKCTNAEARAAFVAAFTYAHGRAPVRGDEWVSAVEGAHAERAEAWLAQDESEGEVEALRLMYEY